MGRGTRGVSVPYYPFIEWNDYYEWEDDEGEDRKWDTIAERKELAERKVAFDECFTGEDIQCG